jgi:hypothetical protein
MDSETDHVQIEVSEEKGYILVKPPRGINFWEILTAIGKLLPQDGFLDKHDIWVFEDGAVSITYEDLGVIKEYGVNHYPKSAEPKKTAIVIETNFQRALAETYISTGEEHPREIQIFSDFKEAEQWVRFE